MGRGMLCLLLQVRQNRLCVDDQELKRVNDKMRICVDDHTYDVRVGTGNETVWDLQINELAFKKNGFEPRFLQTSSQG